MVRFTSKKFGRFWTQGDFGRELLSNQRKKALKIQESLKVAFLSARYKAHMRAI